MMSLIGARERGSHVNNILFVACGGAMGAGCRYVLTNFVKQKILTAFPYGTLGVNLLGCFLIGVFSSYFFKHTEIAKGYQLFLVTGVLGGFTTFSTFSLESVQLLMKEPFLGVMNIALSVLLGLGMVAIGLKI